MTESDDTSQAIEALKEAGLVTEGIPDKQTVEQEEGERAEEALDALERGEATLLRPSRPSQCDGLTAEQHDYLMNPLRSARIAKRSQGGKQLSYLEAWDIKAHLTRVFGFGHWDAEVVEAYALPTREYTTSGDNARKMLEVMWFARLQLTIRDSFGYQLCRYVEGAVGSATGGAAGAGVGDLHDNAMKQAASDALKRCAINLGTQFGLSLYDDGSTQEVVKVTLVRPPGATKGAPPAAAQPTAEQAAALAKSVGRSE